ncbi:hypothetical protein Dda_2965 [Drechslerella dactyloides]|uniref:PUM-HD domain-containing protein n=1 Tax=Drechslerella dactyloides TaxID=74499 RepID=A0AAD6J0K3_DREDA|nr:hypothetical protein Dda_2965 [Drechslerella dactyloides]
MDEQQESSRNPQMPEDLDELLARLEMQEQIIQEQKIELASKKKEVNDLRMVGETGSSRGSQGNMPTAQNNAGSREFLPSTYDNRMTPTAGHPESPGNRANMFEPGDEDFIQDQINKHTFSQAVDPDFYTDGVHHPISPDHLNNMHPFSPVAPRGTGYAGANVWSDGKGKGPSGAPPSLAPVPYWQIPAVQGYHPRPAPDQEPVTDWKAVGADFRRAGPGLNSANAFHGSPGRQAFSPSPLSPPFVPSGATSSWNSANPTTPSSSLNSLPGYPTMPYTGNYSQSVHTDYSAGYRAGPGNWNKSTSASPTQPLGANLYGNSTESPNWKRLMERGVACDWGYLVDRVVMQNDQGASVFLQHKLKDFDHPEHKIEIINAIVEKALPLMTNRFGNFLVQRCFEYGEPYHVEAIMKLIKGRVVQLSMDAFGCHVIQRALDTVPEPFKVMIIQELLHRIPETVMHRYACHVWQKLFEVRWIGTPPQIMKYMNEALSGMWPEIAMGETGSLVVQNIFENCLEEDKRPCVNEVLANLDMIARGQFGNWCIQHICEHGQPRDQSVALDMVLHNAVEYSMDQYASKVVEKCLKSSVAPGFLDRYLERVCEGRADRPRLPIIDIASDQYGNYLIQLILGTAPVHQREFVANHIRKHMVSLRGSKFGSRVGMLCINNNYLHFSSHGSPNGNRSGHGGGHGHHMHGGGHRNHWKGYR